MRTAMTAIALALLLVHTGCIPSVHPLYTEQDLLFDPLLPGVWADTSGKETWTFTKKGDEQYQLIYVDGAGQKGQFAVHLVKVGERRFLDLYPTDLDLLQNDLYNCSLLPVHTFIRIQQQGDMLQMAYMKPEWITQFLKDYPNAVKHETMNDAILLTAQPRELQAFLVQYGTAQDAWSECSPLARRAGE